MRRAFAVLSVAIMAACAQHAGRELRVCADPNNLPFSNDREEGFENRLAHLIATELDATVRYTWWAQRRGFIRNTLRADRCDVIMGMPSAVELAATTTPYYRSSYVFVTRRGEPIPQSLDDPLLRRQRIGVHLIGDDFANAPPAHALTNRGIVNVRGYSIYGDYTRPNPPANLIEAVASGDVDVAIAWGPLAGFFAARHHDSLRLSPVTPELDVPFLPMVYDIGIAVRREDTMLRSELNAALDARRSEIDAILREWHVPVFEQGTLRIDVRQR